VRVEVREAPFDPWGELAAWTPLAAEAGAGGYGATAVFVGTMRDFNGPDPVREMTLEHYPGMTERYLERIAAEATARWGLLDVLVVHRVGRLLPGDPIVLVAARSAHRAAALDACRYLIEELKHRAPFWKKEAVPGGERWVEANTPG
jgi:molybdopterin synthase catalytic subunit